MFSTVRLPGKLKFWLAIAYAAMVLAAMFPFLTVHWARSIILDIDHSERRAGQFVNLLSLVQDVETGQRGFIITGSEDFLDPYRSGVIRLQHARPELRREMANTAPDRDAMAALDRLIDLKLAVAAQTILLRRNSGFGAAQAIVSSATGKAYMDGIRKDIGALIQAEDRRKVDLQNALERRAKQNAYVGLGTTLFGMVLFAALIFQLFRVIVARRRAEKTLSDEHERLEVTLRAIDDGVITTDATTRITYINSGAEKILGQELCNIKDRRLDEVISLTDPKTSKTISNLVGQSMVHGTVFRRDSVSVLHRPDGTACYITDVISPVIDSNGLITEFVIVLHDASADFERARDLNRRASHDAMTGLVNRFEFQRRLTKVFARANYLEVPAAILAIDLDQFKAVNDRGGHAAGDAVLRQVAEILRATVRESDLIARIGGDEFAIILQNCPAARSCVVAQQVLGALNPLQIEWQGSTYEIGASVGVAMIDSKYQSEHEWLAAADHACYEAKRAGRGQLRDAL